MANYMRTYTSLCYTLAFICLCYLFVTFTTIISNQQCFVKFRARYGVWKSLSRDITPYRVYVYIIMSSKTEGVKRWVQLREFSWFS